MVIIIVIQHYARFPLKLKKVACPLQDGLHVSPHCGATLHEIFTAELLCRDDISLECDEKHHCKQRKQSHSLMLIHS